MLSNDQANIIARLIEVGTENNWPSIRRSMLDAGFKPREIVDAVAVVCKQAHVMQSICMDDFE